jgi:hypothetical protein
LFRLVRFSSTSSEINPSTTHKLKSYNPYVTMVIILTKCFVELSSTLFRQRIATI